jgi:hypothetical protein
MQVPRRRRTLDQPRGSRFAQQQASDERRRGDWFAAQAVISRLRARLPRPAQGRAMFRRAQLPMRARSGARWLCWSTSPRTADTRFPTNISPSPTTHVHRAEGEQVLSGDLLSRAGAIRWWPKPAPTLSWLPQRMTDSGNIAGWSIFSELR